MFEELKKSLKESYQHKYLSDTVCVVCGRIEGKFALHILEYSHDNSFNTPKYLVPMSHNNERVRGSVPLCSSCCPSCTKCNLPISPINILSVIKGLSLLDSRIHYRRGNGVCKHIHPIRDLVSLFKRVKLYVNENSGEIIRKPHNAPNINPLYKKKETMSLEDIHDFGIEVVLKQLQKEKYDIISVNSKLNINPQIICKKHNETILIVVRTLCYPHKGSLDDSAKFKMIEHATNLNAIPYFASVGIANASSTNPEEMSIPIKGEGFHVSYSGLQILNS